MSQPSVVLATASYDHTIKFWEAKSARCYRTIQYPESQVNRLEITPDKRFLAAAGNPHIRLFDINSNSTQPLRSFDSHTNNVMAVGFQCDGKWMYSGSEDGTVKIWDLRAPGCQRDYESRAAVNTVVLHPNQTELISGDQNGNIRVWDLRANSCSCELVPEVDTAVRSLTIMWDGSLIVAANNRGTCYVWRLLRGTETMTNFEPLHKLQAHDGYILKCLLSPELCEPHRYLATASSDHTVKIWNVDGFTLEKTLIGHERWVWDCVFSVDGAFLITGNINDSTCTKTSSMIPLGLASDLSADCRTTVLARGVLNPNFLKSEDGMRFVLASKSYRALAIICFPILISIMKLPRSLSIVGTLTRINGEIPDR